MSLDMRITKWRFNGLNCIILFDLCGRKFPSKAQVVQWMNSRFDMLERELNALYIDEDHFQYLLEALQCAYHNGRNAYYLYVNKTPTPTMNQHDQIFEKTKLQTIEEEISEDEMKKVIDNHI
jgi:hypothetical protein